MDNLPAPPSTPPAPPKKKRHIGWWILAAIIVLVAVGVSQTESGTDTDTDSDGVSKGLGSQDASDDVEMGSCSADFSILTCELTITNPTDGASDYYVEATIYDAADANIGTANTFVSRVDAYGTAHAKLTGTFTGKWDSIRLTEVQRTASS